MLTFRAQVLLRNVKKVADSAATSHSTAMKAGYTDNIAKRKRPDVCTVMHESAITRAIELRPIDELKARRADCGEARKQWSEPERDY